MSLYQVELKSDFISDSYRKEFIMKYLLLGTVLCAFLVVPTLAFASCIQITVMRPDGSMQFCQSCCYGGMCQVHCL